MFVDMPGISFHDYLSYIQFAAAETKVHKNIFIE